MVKTLKINDEIHLELQKLGTVGDTFESVIKKLIDEHFDFENVILQVRLTSDDQNPRQIHLKNPLYYWTAENYDFFLDKTLNEFPKAWGENILKRIANNDEWYNKIQQYRKENK